MVIGRLVIHMKPHKKKIAKFVLTPRVWKLEKEEIVILFTREIAARNNNATKADDIQNKWLVTDEGDLGQRF